MTGDIGALVEEAWRGSLGAYEELVRRFQDAVYGAALARLRNWHDAEEASQEAFIEAWRKLGKLREPGKFPAWLRRITISCCSRLRRRATKAGELDAGQADLSGETNPAKQAEEHELKERVLQALGKLSQPLREATTLYYIDGYSQNEVAQFLNLPVGTVKRRLHDSREQLKEAMMSLAEDALKKHRPTEEFTKRVIRVATNEKDLRVAAGHLSHSARHHPDVFKVGGKADSPVVVAEREGQVDTSAWYRKTKMSIAGAVVDCIRVGEVADELGDVGSQVFIDGTLAAFEHARRNGEYLAIAHGDQYNHPRCGYVPCFYHPLARLDTQEALRIQAEGHVRKLRKDEEEEAREGVLADEHATRFGGWELDPDYAVEQEGQVRGYFGYERTDGKWAPKLWVSGITIESAAAARAMLRFLAERAQEEGEKEVYIFEAPWTVVGKIIMELGGSCEVRGTWHEVGQDEEHAAVLDLFGLSKALEGEFKRRLADGGGADGAVSLEMDGEVVAFGVEDGKLNLGKRKQRRHVELPRWIVTRMYLGYYSGGEALEAAGAKPSASLKELLSVLFPKLWPCTIPDFNFWFADREWRKYPPEKEREITNIRWPWLE